jgi:hypothetical protein
MNIKLDRCTCRRTLATHTSTLGLRNMKWREPWRETLKRQPPLNLLSRENIQNVLIWTAIFFGFFVLPVAMGKSSMSEAVLRSWIAPVLGFVIGSLHTLGHWLSPLEVSSGPRGIVRQKGEALALIPWSAIRSFRIRTNGVERILELEVSYSPETVLLYLSPKVNAAVIEAEIRSYLHTDI